MSRPAALEWVVCPECGMPEKCKRMEVCQLMPESETPEDVAYVLGTIPKAHTMPNAVEKDMAYLPSEMRLLRDYIRSLERRLSLAQTEIKGHMRVEDELRAEIARHSRILFEPLGDNHHNAWACPYCNPHIEEQRSKLAQAQARIAELEKERDELKHHIAVTEALKGRA